MKDQSNSEGHFWVLKIGGATYCHVIAGEDAWISLPRLLVSYRFFLLYCVFVSFSFTLER